MPNPAFRRLALGIQGSASGFDPLARSYGAPVFSAETAPIFIVGPPRSGSTFIYQALIDHFRLAYIDNLMALLPRFMVAIHWVERRLLPEYRVKFDRGDYGFVSGIRGPSEAGKVLEEWFAEDPHSRCREPVRTMFHALARQASAPVVVKSLSLSSRLRAVLSVLPEARIVRLSRSPAFVAQSIVEGRRNPRIGEDVLPALVPGEPPPGGGDGYRAVWELARLEAEMDQALSGMSPAQFVEIEYEEFFREPELQLEKVAGHLSLTRSGRATTLEGRVLSQKRRVAGSTWSEILSACREFGLPLPRGQTDVEPDA